MKKEEFVKHIKVNKYEVDIGLDDYGQCYFFEYKDKRGDIQEVSCGTYNSQYIEYIYCELDPIYRELSRLELYDELDDFQKQYLDYYKMIIRRLYSSDEGLKIKLLFSNSEWEVWKKNRDLIITHSVDERFDSEIKINLDDYSVKLN